MRRTAGWILLALLASSGLFAAEPGGWKARSVAQRPSAPGQSAPAPNAIVADPAGDTFGSGFYRPDLIEFEAQFDVDSLLLFLTAADPISPSDSAEANATVATIDLDVDQLPSTGGVSVSDLVCPQVTGMGMDYWVDLFSYSSSTGQADVNDSFGDPVGSADVLFFSNGISITVPFSAIGFDDGVVNAVAVLGSIDGGFGEATDCAPDGAVLASTLVPVELLNLSIE